MNLGSELTKRRFFIWMAGTGATLMASAVGIRLWWKTDVQGLQEVFGRTSLSHWRTAGEVYLTHFPEEADHQLLLERIFGTAEAQRSKGVRRVREFLRSRVRDDFENGSVVLIGGWILSQTEARLAALVALSPK